MSLLGIDVGTSGCKAAAFSEQGQLLAQAQEEYDILHPRPGWAELDTLEVWKKIKSTIRRAASGTKSDRVTALAVSSLGEAIVPVAKDRQILGPSILNFDERGGEYLQSLSAQLPDEALFRINGNTWGNHYGLTKLKWIQEQQPDLYQQADKFLLWQSFVSFMLGAEPAVDYSLANRTLLFDLDRETWSDEILALARLDRHKLAEPVPAGTIIGALTQEIASDLGLPPRVAIAAGAHDQCSNAVGCGVIREGLAVFGMGTFLCITPVFARRPDPPVMMRSGLSIEHHAVPGRYVTFIYNQGGSLVKWFRDTFAITDQRIAEAAGRSIYPDLFAEMPDEPSPVIALPHFSTTGPPDFISDSYGVLAGLRLETTRGEILKGIVEGATFYLKACIDDLPGTGIEIEAYRVVGGGSRSEAWVQLCADILGKSFTRPAVSEAGALGAAIIAGVGQGTFPTYEAGVEAMVRLERTFEPDPERQARYQGRYEKYTRLWPLLKDYLRELNPSFLEPNRAASR